MAQQRENTKKMRLSQHEMGRGYVFQIGGFQTPDYMIDEYPTDCQRDKLF